MTFRDDVVTARNAGRAAKLGDMNPYAGQGVLADMWRLGYQSMLLDRVLLTADFRRYVDDSMTDS